MSDKKGKKKSGEKCLYTCECVIDSYEYSKMARYFPKRIYWVFVLRGAFKNLLISAVIAILSKSLIYTIGFFVVYQIYLMLLYSVRLEHYVEEVFDASNNRGEIDTIFETEFYEDYFIRKGEKASITIHYSEISRCVENDTHFYLEYIPRNMIIILPKNTCDLELINFIREKFKDLENCLGDKAKFKGTKFYHSPQFIEIFMLILFILTILSLLGAQKTLEFVDKINPQHGYSAIKNNWVYWLWLPLPILSVIFGLKYKRRGHKCTKNIIWGLIISFFLFIFGFYSTFPTFSQDYSEIDVYRNIIDATLPNNGDLEIQNWDTYFDKDKTEYTIINAYYDREDVSELVNSIENNDNWILSKDINFNLKMLIPSTLSLDYDAYFSIYNNTTNQYNTLPEIPGDYEIYVMKYDKSDKMLEIHAFNYAFAYKKR